MNQAITVRISDDMKKNLDELSKSEKKPVSDLVRDSIDRYTTISRFRKLRNMTLLFAEAQGILTDENVFKIMLQAKKLY
jgi:predicted transcriptional regulator